MTVHGEKQDTTESAASADESEDHGVGRDEDAGSPPAPIPTPAADDDVRCATTASSPSVAPTPAPNGLTNERSDEETISDRRAEEGLGREQSPSQSAGVKTEHGKRTPMELASVLPCRLIRWLTLRARSNRSRWKNGQRGEGTVGGIRSVIAETNHTEASPKEKRRRVDGK